MRCHLRALQDCLIIEALGAIVDFAYLIPDTNIFLHFPPLEEVDWLKIAGVHNAIIAIAPVVTRELNHHKDNPRSRKLRDRADDALKDLHARYKGQRPHELRKGVELMFLARDPVLDFTSYGLVRELPDDVRTLSELLRWNGASCLRVVSEQFG
jgi:hypothetical protein